MSEDDGGLLRLNGFGKIQFDMKYLYVLRGKTTSTELNINDWPFKALLLLFEDVMEMPEEHWFCGTRQAHNTEPFNELIWPSLSSPVDSDCRGPLMGIVGREIESPLHLLSDGQVNQWATKGIEVSARQNVPNNEAKPHFRVRQSGNLVMDKVCQPTCLCNCKLISGQCTRETFTSAVVLPWIRDSIIGLNGENKVKHS